MEGTSGNARKVKTPETYLSASVQPWLQLVVFVYLSDYLCQLGY